MRDGVRVQLAEVTPTHEILKNFAGGSDYQISREADARVPVQYEDPDFNLFLSKDAARALYEELSRFYGGSPSTVTDRADLLAERARVDKLIDSVIDSASKLKLGSGY
jgi:hypothetical protein